jgi:hypothetical protein
MAPSNCRSQFDKVSTLPITAADVEESVNTG